MTRQIMPWLPVAASLFFAVTACSGPAVVESSATAVTVRYGGLDAIEEVTQIAQKACALHHKTARLRNTAHFGLSEHYGHFDCV